MLQHLPEDWRQASLLGRLQGPDGPVPILVRGGRAFDVATSGPTTADIAAEWREDADFSGTELGDLDSLGFVPAWDPAAKSARFRLLSPLDLQCIKASGVTFANSAVERVIEERARGDAGRAQSVRDSLKARVGTDIRSVNPGSAQATLLKEALIADGLWSQYLEVAIGPDAEIFTKAPVLSSVGWGDWIGVRADSAWNNPEPEIVLVCDPAGRAVGATLGTMFAPVDDRDAPGRGFTHKRGDLVSVFSDKLGTLYNKVTTCDATPPWSMGVSALMRNLAARGLLDGPGARAGSRS